MPNWIEWNGGDCPVDPATPVFVLLRNGTASEATHPAGEYNWNPDSSPRAEMRRKFDIVGYRLA